MDYNIFRKIIDRIKNKLNGYENFSKYVFPFNSLENQKSSNNSLNIIPISVYNRNIKSSKKENSYKHDDIYLNINQNYKNAYYFYQ